MRRKKRPVRILKWLMVLLAGALALMLAVYFATPALVARFAPQFAERLGVTTIELNIGSPGLRGMTINRLKLVGDEFSLVGENAVINYTLGNLIDGQLDKVTFESLSVSINSANEGDQSPTPEQVLPILPIGQLIVEQLALEFPDTGLVAVGHAELGVSSLVFSLQGVEPEPASHFNISASLSRQGIFNARFGERDGDDEFLTMSGAITEDALHIEGQFDAHGYVLELVSAIAGLPPGTGTVVGRFETQLTWPLAEALVWQDATASLPAISIDWTAADNGLELKGLSGAIEIDRGNVTALISGAAHARLNDYAVDFQFPADYQLVYEANQIDGVGNLELRAKNTDQDLMAKFRSFSVNTADGAAINFDADVRANSAEVRADGALNGEITLASAEPTHGQGRLDFAGTVMVADQPYASAIQAHFKVAESDLQAEGLLTSSIVDKAPFRLDYDIASGAGELSATNTINFRQPLGATVIPDWAEAYDLDSGQIDAALKLNWQSFDKVATELTLKLVDVTGHYDSYHASGISGDLEFTANDVSAGESWQLLQSTIQLGHVNVGVPVTDMAVKVAWSGDQAQIAEATASLLGGQAIATPFVYDLGTGGARLELDLQNLDLAAVLALEGDDIVGSGRLNGTLPVVLNNDEISINDGSVAAAPPGGTIRLTPTLSGPSGQPGLDFALLALKDFSYTELNTDINYAANGDLQLAVHLKGRNPAVEDGRPIHYNLNINENVPVLLESLRLQDQVTERIEAEAKK